MKTLRRITILLVAALATGCAGSVDRSTDDERKQDAAVETVIQSEIVSYPPISGTPGVVEVRGGDEEALRTLLGRILQYGGPHAPSAIVLVGQLPESLQFTLPLPENKTVLGSIIRDEDSYYSTEIYLDTELIPEETLEFFREALGAEEWRRLEEPPYQSGFVPSEVSQSESYCHKRTEASLWISAFPLEEDRTDLRITVQTTSAYSICNQSYGGPYGDQAQAILPAVSSPPGADIRSNGMSSGGNQGDMSATIRTDLSLDQLTSHYEDQLAEKGWAQIGSESSDVASWSIWQIESEELETWIGTLLIFESAVHEDEMVAWFRVELQENGN